MCTNCQESFHQYDCTWSISISLGEKWLFTIFYDNTLSSEFTKNPIAIDYFDALHTFRQSFMKAIYSNKVRKAVKKQCQLSLGNSQIREKAYYKHNTDV